MVKLSKATLGRIALAMLVANFSIRVVFLRSISWGLRLESNLSISWRCWTDMTEPESIVLATAMRQTCGKNLRPHQNTPLMEGTIL